MASTIWERARSAITGRFVKKKYAKKHKRSTVVEKRRIRK